MDNPLINACFTCLILNGTNPHIDIKITHNLRGGFFILADGNVWTRADGKPYEFQRIEPAIAAVADNQREIIDFLAHRPR